MNRRRFLKLLGMAPVLAMLPSTWSDPPDLYYNETYLDLVSFEKDGFTLVQHSSFPMPDSNSVGEITGVGFEPTAVFFFGQSA